ncbi:3-keto-disaccharide hydrolase [Cyclobacterium salsum]|uniref:3-keto-disaccharide hydrolase n=1 Tax=Cyclobacterium salsum TaxID=2666329 RepID=UPI001F2541B6|nr:DUF1080 domain-containing protein [Cyclobacterium salsum]
MKIFRNLFLSPICLFLMGISIFVVLPGVGQSLPSPTAWQRGTMIPLFDGENLNAWYTFIQDRGRNQDPLQVFQVEGGILKISGEEWGCITTKNPYDNFILKASFRWTGETYGDRKAKARDSGILIHSQGTDGGYNGIWMHGIEVQIIEGGTGDFIVVGDGSTSFGISSPVVHKEPGNARVFDPKGDWERIHGGRINWYGRSPNWSDTIDFRGKQDVEAEVGDWNELEIQAWEGNVAVYLNGKLVNFAKSVRPEYGRIQVQSEGASIAFREIALFPLLKK